MLDLIYLVACVSFAFMLLTLIVVALKYAVLFTVRVAACVMVLIGVAFGSVLVASSFVSPLPFWTLLPIAVASGVISWRLLIYRARPLRRRP